MPRFTLTPAEIKRLEQGDELSKFVHALLNEWDRRGLHDISASATMRNGRPYHLVPVAPAGVQLPMEPPNGTVIQAVSNGADQAPGEG